MESSIYSVAVAEVSRAAESRKDVQQEGPSEIQKTCRRDFPGGPLAKIPHSYTNKVLGFNPWLAN